VYNFVLFFHVHQNQLIYEFYIFFLILFYDSYPRTGKHLYLTYQMTSHFQNYLWILFNYII